jgi:hypothetical protein
LAHLEALFLYIVKTIKHPHIAVMSRSNKGTIPPKNQYLMAFFASNEKQKPFVWMFTDKICYLRSIKRQRGQLFKCPNITFLIFKV